MIWSLDPLDRNMPLRGDPKITQQSVQPSGEPAYHHRALTSINSKVGPLFQCVQCVLNMAKLDMRLRGKIFHVFQFGFAVMGFEMQRGSDDALAAA